VVVSEHEVLENKSQSVIVIAKWKPGDEFPVQDAEYSQVETLEDMDGMV
jgi:hypothetical protein